MKKFDLSGVKTQDQKYEEYKAAREAVKEEVLRRLPCTNYLEKGRVSGYVCIYCGSGKGDKGTGAVKYYKNTNTCACHACADPGQKARKFDVLDIIMNKWGCDFETALQIGADELGLEMPIYGKAEPGRTYPAPNKAIETAQGADNPTDDKQTTQTVKGAGNGPQEATEPAPADYTEYYSACRARLNAPEAVSYLQARGISPETAARYWIGYDPAADPASAPGAMGSERKPHPAPRIIIPTTRAHYVGRAIDPDTPKGYVKMNPSREKGAGSIGLFNKAGLYKKGIDAVFITEGAFDALAIIEAGQEAIALNSTSNAEKLIKQLEEKPTAAKLILCLDNDDAGSKATGILKEGLQRLKAHYVAADICGSHKDPNEALTADRKTFVKAVQTAAALEPEKLEENPAAIENIFDEIRKYINIAQTADTFTQFNAAKRAAERLLRSTISHEEERTIDMQATYNYLTSGAFETDIEYFKAYKNRKMGYEGIDKYLTLYPGLAFLGGASSLGKTTFITNVIDKLLKNGETVLYFSLEQLPIEIITKGLARRMYDKDPYTKLTNIAIKDGAGGAELETVKKEYAAEAQNLYIFTGDFRMTAAGISDRVNAFIDKTGCKQPIVIIDYLQLIAPPENFRGGIRETTDENIKALKDMQKTLGLFVVVVSSFNRSSNYEPVSYESFKETSMIEYTADYIWGLQLAILDAENTDFYTVEGTRGGRSERPIDQKRKLINEAQQENPKRVEFVSLKNRNGKQFFKAFFEYFPQHDIFIEKPAIGDGFKAYTGESIFDKKEEAPRL